MIVIGVVELVNGSMDHQLNAWGILPRTVHGLAGIPLSPFLHGSFSHVMSNAVTFLGLGGLIGLRGRQVTGFFNRYFDRRSRSLGIWPLT